MYSFDNLRTNIPQRISLPYSKQGVPVPPKLSLPEMNSGYDAKWGGVGYDGSPNCDNYVVPPDVVG
jgi:hypothetical protein